MQQTWHIRAVSLRSFMNAIISHRAVHDTLDPVIIFAKCPSNFMLRGKTPGQSHQQLDPTSVNNDTQVGE
jgi:hypothetical protein